MTQLRVLNWWHISRFPGHVSIVSRVDHVLTKEISRNRFSAVNWPIYTSCMLISQRITFTPQCHDFYARDSQHYKLMEWKEIGQFADMRRRRVPGEPDAYANRTRPLEHSHCSANPTRTVHVHCEYPLVWSECTGRTRRSGRRVCAQPDA